MLEAAIEAGADDAQSSEAGHEIYCALDQVSAVSGALEARYGEAESVKLVWRPKLIVGVEGQAAETLLKMLSALEDCDDVQNVYANFELSAEDLERLSE